MGEDGAVELRKVQRTLPVIARTPAFILSEMGASKGFLEEQ